MWRFVLILILLVAEFAMPQEVIAFRKVELGGKMPAFVADRVEGGQFNSNQLQGHVTILVFYSTRQRYSEQALAELGQLYRTYKEEKLTIVAIATDRERADVEKFTKRLAEPFVWLFDRDRELFGLFGVIVTPTTAQFDRSGVLRYYEPEHSSDYSISLDLGLKVLLGKMSDEERGQALARAGQPLLSEARRKAQRLSALAEDFLQRHQTDQALVSAQDALKADPDYAVAKVTLGEVLLSQNKFEEAEKQFVAALQTAKPPYRAQLGLGTALSRRGRNKEAFEILEKLRDVRVDKVKLYYELGRLAEDQGQTKEAIENFRKSAEASLNKGEN